MHYSESRLLNASTTVPPRRVHLRPSGPSGTVTSQDRGTRSDSVSTGAQGARVPWPCAHRRVPRSKRAHQQHAGRGAWVGVLGQRVSGPPRPGGGAEPGQAGTDAPGRPGPAGPPGFPRKKAPGTGGGSVQPRSGPALALRAPGGDSAHSGASPPTPLRSQAELGCSLAR